MKAPPLLKARYAKAFSRAHDNMGLSSAGPLAKANLHERALSDVENWIPVSQLKNFVTASIRQNGCWELGLVASMPPRQQHSVFSRKVLFKPTLHQSLSSICHNSHLEDMSARFKLVLNGEATRLDCGAIKVHRNGFSNLNSIDSAGYWRSFVTRQVLTGYHRFCICRVSMMAI